MRRVHGAVGLTALACVSLLIGSCADGQSTGNSVGTGDSLGVLRSREQLPATMGDDPWEVVVCHVPVDTTDPMYEPIPDRLELSADELIAQMTPVVGYFERWSQGRYRPVFAAGPEVTVPAAEGGSDASCVDAAIAGSSADVRGVLVIADAQHTAAAVGGWGRPGAPCAAEKCSARETGRAVYVGAADFMPYWQGDPPLDLIEHEMGHALGWPHSSTSADSFGQGVYDSVIDVMSNSAAPRDMVPASRNAPGALALNMYLAGWIDDGDVQVIDATSLTSEPVTFEIVANNTASGGGTRLAVVNVSATSFLTIEMITSGVDNVHIGRSGVAVHLVDFSDSVCDVPPCTGTARRQTLESASESGDGLLRAGGSVAVGDIRVSVDSVFVGSSGESSVVLVSEDA